MKMEGLHFFEVMLITILLQPSRCRIDLSSVLVLIYRASGSLPSTHEGKSFTRITNKDSYINEFKDIFVHRR